MPPSNTQTIETLLQAVEAEGEAAGWDSDLSQPMIFAIMDTPTGLEVDWPDAINGLLKAALRVTGGDAGEAVQLMVKLLSMTGIKAADNFLGFGFRSEVWMLSVESESDDAAVHAHKVHEHPDRVEARNVWWFGRDGVQKWVLRRRGQPVDAEMASGVSGNIPNAMTKLLNFVCPESVPVVPTNLEGDK